MNVQMGSGQVQHIKSKFPTYIEYVKGVFEYIPLDQWKGGIVVIKTP